MTDAKTLGMIREALGAVAPKRKADFASLATTQTIESLGLDSIATMEMVAKLEEATKTTFADEDLAKVQTVGDLATLVSRAQS